MMKLHKPATGLLVLRVALGLIFFLHGWLNFTGGRESFLRAMLVMVDLSLPEVLLWVLTIVELAGGVALLLGLFTRIAAVVLAGEMVVAVVLFHLQQGFLIIAIPSAPLAYGFEYHIALIGGLTCLFLAGPGAWALDTRFNSLARLRVATRLQKGE